MNIELIIFNIIIFLLILRSIRLRIINLFFYYLADSFHYNDTKMTRILAAAPESKLKLIAVGNFPGNLI